MDLICNTAQYWPICYTNQLPKDIKLRWGFTCCAMCMVDWIETKAKPDFIPNLTNRFSRGLQDNNWIPCINSACQKKDTELVVSDEKAQEHTLTYDEWFDFIGGANNLGEFGRFTDIMLNITAVHDSDFRKCPKASCNFIGTIDMKPCPDLLQWAKCEYQWADPVLYPIRKRLGIKFENFFSVDSEMVNNIQKVLKGEPCPNCGIWIIKLNGCSHMVCGKWQYEFCWDCLGHYPGYVHQTQTFCPIRKVIIYLAVFYFLFMSINDKICIRYPFLGDIEGVFFNWLAFFIVANLYFIISFIWIIAYNEMNSSRSMMAQFPDYIEGYRKTYNWCLVIVILFPVVYFGGSLLLYVSSQYFRDMITLLIIEAFIVIAIIILVVFVWLVQCLMFTSHNPVYTEEEEYNIIDSEEHSFGPHIDNDFEEFPNRPRMMPIQNTGRWISIIFRKLTATIVERAVR